MDINKREYWFCITIFMNMTCYLQRITETFLFYLHSFTLQTKVYQHEFNFMQIKLKPSIRERPRQGVGLHRDCPRVPGKTLQKIFLQSLARQSLQHNFLYERRCILHLCCPTTHRAFFFFSISVLISKNLPFKYRDMRCLRAWRQEMCLKKAGMSSNPKNLLLK